MTPARGTRRTPPPEPVEGAGSDPFERSLPADNGTADAGTAASTRPMGSPAAGEPIADEPIAEEPPVAASAHAHGGAAGVSAPPRRPNRVVASVAALGPDELLATLVALATSAIATIGGLILVIARAVGGSGRWVASAPLRQAPTVVTVTSGLAFWVGLVLLVVGLLGLGILGGRLLARR